MLSWCTEAQTACKKEHSIGLKQQEEGLEANSEPGLSVRTFRTTELILCFRLIRFFGMEHASEARSGYVFTVSLPEVREKRRADVYFQAVRAHLRTQRLQVSPGGASEW